MDTTWLHDMNISLTALLVIFVQPIVVLDSRSRQPQRTNWPCLHSLVSPIPSNPHSAPPELPKQHSSHLVHEHPSQTLGT